MSAACEPADGEVRPAPPSRPTRPHMQHRVRALDEAERRTLAYARVSSHGQKAHKRLLAALRRRSRALSRKRKGSVNRRKAKACLARLHARIANIRRDAAHKATTRIAKGWRRIAVEDLNVRGMAANRRLARSIVDGGFHEFRRQLEYKARMYGATAIVADRWYPSSRTRSCCGSVLAELDLSQRTYRRPACGLEIDRDLNAARNFEQLAASSAATACRGTRSGAAAARTPRGRTARAKPPAPDPFRGIPAKQEPNGKAERLHTDAVRFA